MFIDTHAHLNFNAYKNDYNEVAKRSLAENVWLINVGSQYTTSKRAVKIAEKYHQGVYAAVGLHPIHLETGLVKIKEDQEEITLQTIEEDFNYEEYKKLALSSGRVVAIGEIGLDYYRNPKTKSRLALFKEKQKEILLKQIRLAKELNLPIIFHCRMAHDDLLEILSAEGGQGVIHCFTGTWEQTQKYLEMGFYFGLNGIIFRMNLNEIIKKMPLDKILLETDCPYLTPPQAEGPAFAKASAGKRNEPIYIKYIAQKIAQIKGLSYEEVRDTTTQNARNLFKI